jgi:hypothetical protein
VEPRPRDPEARRDEPLAPARGVVVGLVAGTLIWVAIALIVRTVLF